ncbi:Neurexin-4 [Hypsibius exemplaris]|uniref:Neurexin-4 n=1 Tax=Hypsibius exemplaris TaxID=2072580 RepID=A0A9X6RLP0_HYPEX|nr:Neurexin-4 [Hypsibius exemplaris]
MIALRIELFGCDYATDIASFDGQSYIRIDLTFQPIISVVDRLHFRFKTIESEGCSFTPWISRRHFCGATRAIVPDFDDRLGGGKNTIVKLGSAVDDGVGTRHGKTLRVAWNELRFKQHQHHLAAPTLHPTRDFRLDTLTFTGVDAHLKLSPLTAQHNINVSLCLRTYEVRGQILRRDFVEHGFAKVSIDRGQLKFWLQGTSLPEIHLEPFPGSMVNDGVWHCYSLAMQTNLIVQTLDDKISSTKRLLTFLPKTDYRFGASEARSEERGFRGCIRNIVTDGQMWDVASLASQTSSFVTVNDCRMRDRHGGRCLQSWDEFVCDCTGTGYSGAVCKTSSLPLSCEEYHRYHPSSRSAVVHLDMDGSGDLAPFSVLCKFEPDGRTEVHVHHDSMGESVVDGFQLPASYIQTINYNATWSQLTALINQSHVCRQQGKYSCRNAKLLNTPNGPPFGLWSTRSNRLMDTWAGVSPGISACMCGLSESCYDRSRGCNCDANDDPLRAEFLVDEGWFSPKDYLPVRQFAFGDTGSLTDSKESKYTLGPLICEGSHLMDNSVTFWRQDATLRFPFTDWGQNGDLYFQFRTTVESAVFLHSRGEKDELKVTLISPTELQFYHVSGSNGPKTVSVQTTRQLNDNEWHSVLIERNRLESRLRVDGAFSSAVRTSDEVFRPLQLGGQLLVGAASDLSNGFVGCLRTLMVNGIMFDLKYLVQKGTYGIVAGCLGKCDSSPCFNGGICQERYDQYKCDCRFTAFRGPLCSDEIGAHFRAEDFVEYTLPSPISTVGERIRVAFVTSEPRGILLQVNGATGDYLTIEMSNAGTIRVAFDLGFERQEIYEESENYPNGQFHDVTVWRTNNGRTVNVQADDHEVVSRTYRIESKQDTQLNSVKTIYLGRNYSMSGREGFIGCLSRVSFDDFFILKQLFQQKPPQHVRANRRLREDWCDVQPATHPEEVIPPRPDMMMPYPLLPGEIGTQSANGNYDVFLGVLLAGVMVVVTAGGGLLFARFYALQTERTQRGQLRSSGNEPEEWEPLRADVEVELKNTPETAVSVEQGSTDL